jgi:hypothetical protein
MNLKTPYAEEVISMLEEAQDIGMAMRSGTRVIMDWPLNILLSAFSIPTARHIALGASDDV